MSEPETQAAGADRRQEARKSVSLPGTLLFKGGQADCTVYDISPGGALVSASDAVPDGLPLRLKVTQSGEFLGMIAWRKEDRIGLRFVQFLEDGLEMPERAAPKPRLTVTPVAQSNQ